VRFNDSTGRSTFAISQNGVLVYRGGVFRADRQLNWRDRNGKVLSAVGTPGPFISLSLSPNGKSVVLVVGPAGGRLDVWAMNLASGVLTPMTHDGKQSINSTPAWSPDSERLAVSPATGGVQEITVASGKIAVLGKEPEIADDWSPDGRSILGIDNALTRLSLLSLAHGGQVRTILITPYRQRAYRFSPDGKYVVYTSRETGRDEIYVAAFPSFSVKRLLSTGGGGFPIWEQGGKELFCQASDGTLMDVDIRLGANIEAGIPKPLFQFGLGTTFNRFAVTPDGQRFLIDDLLQSVSPADAELMVVINWTAEMKKQRVRGTFPAGA
jgi:Tol biopolymer transport system component